MILAKISEGTANWLKTLDTAPEPLGVFINEEHRRYVRVLNEKLKRLDKLLQKYLDLPID